MRKHAIDSRRAAAEPFSAWWTSDRPRDDERPDRRRPRRHDDPFRERESDGPRDPGRDPRRYDRHASRHRLRSWEGGSWGDGELDDESPEPA